MTAISSFRPLADNLEVAENQLRANATWQEMFDSILLIGPEEPLLSSPITQFVPGEDFPTIREIATIASLCTEWVVFLNADIVLLPNFTLAAVSVGKRKGKAFTSRRYEFDPKTGAEPQIVDWGYDIFGTTPDVWRRISMEVPEQYRIGHCAFDTWILNFFQTNFGSNLMDITKWQCVLHPKHSERKRVHHIELAHDRYTP